MGTENCPKVTAEERQRVLHLEVLRQEHGYQAGWLYYRCKDAGLLEAYREWKAEGLIGSTGQTDAPPVAGEPRPLLTIELVPETCWFSNVRSEVTEEDWGKLKRLTFQKAGDRCQICGGRGRQWPVECHELWHYDDEHRRQTLTGLLALCPACHEVKHMGLAGVRGRAEIAARHLAAVNGWSARETDQYVTSQFSVWKRRSQYQWQLNIRWLEQLGISVSRTR